MSRNEGVPPVASGGSDERAHMLSLINANWTTQALSAATRIGLPDLLQAGTQTAEALALATRCHGPSLRRLLRALTSLDVLHEPVDGSFALTPAGALLCSRTCGSLAGWAMLCGTSSWDAWGRLEDSLRDGQSSRKRNGGADGFAFLEDHPESALLFNRAMVGLTRPIAQSVARTLDFSGLGVVMDVGGGHGELLATILAGQPTLHGILFDLAHATQGAADRLTEAGVEDRCTLVAGDFFDSIPGGADAYLLKSILHDWDDERAGAILRSCRRAMASHARLFVIERIAPERLTSSVADQAIARSDLQMLVSTGGRERTRQQYETLLDNARLRIVGNLALCAPFAVLEAAPC